MTEAMYSIEPDVALSRYYPGFRQPLRAWSFTLSAAPAQPDWAQLDRWLAAWMDTPPVELTPAALADSVGPSQDALVPLAWRVMQAAASLLAATGTPLFEAGRLLRVRADDLDSSRWQCDCLIPQITGVTDATLQLAYSTCAEWVLRSAHTAPETDLLNAFYRHLDTAVLPALLARAVASPSARELLKAAWASDIPWHAEGQDIFQIGWGVHAVHCKSSLIGTDSSLGIGIVGNKLLAAQWLRRAGMPAPMHHVVAHPEHALEAARLLNWPVVVKPVSRDRGEGVTVDVRSAAQLQQAYERAAGLSRQVLIEQQAVGVCHRVLVVKGEVIYVVKRLPVAVLGDGLRTVAELVTDQNRRCLRQPPWRRPPPLQLDDLARHCLRQAGLSAEGIVPAGVWAPLRLIESAADGGRDEDRWAVLHPDNACLAIEAAALFGLDMAGVDIMTTDISVPWHANGALINEVNAAPALGASQMSLDAMPALIRRLLGGAGRIPVEAFVGASALHQARARQRELTNQGLRCYLTSDTLTLGPDAEEVRLTVRKLPLRCVALLRQRSVEALILVAGAAQWRDDPLPLDRVDRVINCDD